MRPLHWILPIFRFGLPKLLLSVFAIMTPARAAVKQLAVLTGGNRGIGLEVCRQLVALGDQHDGLPYQVLLGTRDLKKGEKAWKDLGSPPSVRPIELDVTLETSIAQAKNHRKRLQWCLGRSYQ